MMKRRRKRRRSRSPLPSPPMEKLFVVVFIVYKMCASDYHTSIYKCTTDVRYQRPGIEKWQWLDQEKKIEFIWVYILYSCVCYDSGRPVCMYRCRELQSKLFLLTTPNMFFDLFFIFYSSLFLSFIFYLFSFHSFSRPHIHSLWFFSIKKFLLIFHKFLSVQREDCLHYDSLFYFYWYFHPHGTFG